MYHLNTLKHIYHTKVYTSLALLHSIYESHLRSGLRRTGLFLHDYSASRETSLSFGERPLTSCPGFRPGLHGTDYPQISPSIQKEQNTFFNCLSATLSSFFRYREISLPSRQKTHWLALPPYHRLPRRFSRGLFPHCGRLLLHPEGLSFIMRKVLRYAHSLTMLVSPMTITGHRQRSGGGIPDPAGWKCRTPRSPGGL